MRQLCERKDVEIIEATACPDHIHMLVSIPPKLSVSVSLIAQSLLVYVRLQISRILLRCTFRIFQIKKLLKVNL